MPELPEIETVRRIVGPQVIGHSIEYTEVNLPKTVGHPDVERFVSGTVGKRFVLHDRRGKALILGLDDGSRLIIRFGMTGQLMFCPQNYPEERHTHVRFRLDKGMELRFIDQRRFGNMYLIAPGEEDTFSGLSRLGLEPFDGRLDGKWLKENMGKKAVPIKSALLDQSIVTGIGNIWADEMLFRTRIHPESPCASISTVKWNLLARTIPEVMNFGIEKNSMTPEEYLEGKGRRYYDIDYLEAYGRDGEPCTRCGTLLKRSVIGDRSAHWCPRCQRRCDVKKKQIH
ncbi:MAG: bifunctional DNA-formamidopyrimidine glycosylase/DNA-(apurinic or apyrimidinic site) lyase [archaeon]|nr:bifunctional DNA-formamidopyrimidine glycosylase/DNA-(apurinic or apyrimidinic site) lyase [archaeon]